MQHIPRLIHGHNALMQAFQHQGQHIALIAHLAQHRAQTMGHAIKCLPDRLQIGRQGLLDLHQFSLAELLRSFHQDIRGLAHHMRQIHGHRQQQHCQRQHNAQQQPAENRQRAGIGG